MDARRALALAALLTAGLGALHLWLAGTLELSPDEAYYWTWTKDLSLSYPDHPPLVAWLVAAGTALAGDTELGVRWPFVLLGTALVPLAFLIGRRSGLRPGLALLAAAAVGTSLLGSAGALLATPETPLVFGWALGLLGLVNASRGGPGRASWILLAAGVAVSLLAKLTGVLLPIVIVLWILTDGTQARRRRSAPWLALALGSLAAVPFYVADLLQGGATVFQVSHGLWSPGLGIGERLGNLGAYLAGQLGLFGLWFVPAAAVFLLRFRGRSSADSALWLSSALPWFAFAFAALLAPPESNWPACAHIGALVGAARAVEEARERGARWARPAWVAAALGLQLAVSLLVHVHIVRPFLPLETAEPAPFTGPTDPAARLHGWRELVEALRRQGEPVLAGWYGAAAELEFYGPTTTTPTTPTNEASAASPEPRASASGLAGVWEARLMLVPSPGSGLPGQERAGLPPGCEVLPMDPRAMDPGLVHPTAPVRIECAACPVRSAR